MLDKVKAGQDLVIPASDYNGFIDAAVAFKTSGKPSPAQRSVPISNGLVLSVSNRNSEYQKRFATMKVAGAVTLPSASDKQSFYAAQSLAADVTDGGYGQWGVLLQGLDKKQVGDMVVTGVVACRIDLRDQSHTNVTYSTDDDKPYCVSCDGGDGIILWVKGTDPDPLKNGVGKAAATGEQDAVILLTGEPAQIWAKLDTQDTADWTKYGFTQHTRTFNATTGTYEFDETDDGITGTLLDSPAVERNSRPTALPNEYYLLTRGWRMDDDGKLNPVWWFDGPPGLWAQITGKSSISGQANRYAYTWTQVSYVRDGSFITVPAGLTNATAKYGGAAYNSTEANNTTTQVGSGIDLSGLPSTMTMKEIRFNPVQYLVPVMTCDVPPVRQWTFDSANAVQGSCP